MKIGNCLLIFIVFVGNILFAGEAMFSVEDIYSKNPLAGKYNSYSWIRNSNNLLYLQDNEVYLLDSNNKEYYPVVTKKIIGDNVKIVKFIPNNGFTRLLLQTEKNWLLFNIEGNKISKLEDNISYPSFSPDDKYLSYIKNNNIIIKDLTNNTVFSVTDDGSEELLNGTIDWVYGEEIYGREDPNGYKWSGDSKYIAFYRMIESDVKKIPILEKNYPYEKVTYQYYPTAGTKNPDVLLMLYNLEDKTLLPVVSSAEFGDNGYIPYYEFDKNSHNLYVFYLNRNQTELSIYLFDPDNNKRKKVFTDEDPYWLNVQDSKNLFKPLKNGSFLVASEKDGFRHLYIVRQNKISAVTKGEYQVEALNYVDETNNKIYFTSTKKSPLERHLYSIDFDGNNLKQLTQLRGTHDVSFGDNNQYYIDYYSNVERPTMVLMYTISGEPYLTLDENKAPILGYNIMKPEFITFRDEENNLYYGQLIKPIDFDKNKKYPLIIYIYGGPGSQSVRDMWGGNRYLFNQILANHGYLIFTMDNRGSYGRGKKWENILYKEFGKNELEDQIKGIENVKSYGFVDENKISIWGWSYGGYMTTYAMTKRPDIFKVGVAGAPVIDWKNYDTIYTERYLKLPQDNEEGYLLSSPLHYIKDLEGDYLIIHGTADDNVHIQNSIQLISEAVKLNKLINVMIYPGEMHGFGDTSSLHLYNFILDFFVNHL